MPVSARQGVRAAAGLAFLGVAGFAVLQSTAASLDRQGRPGLALSVSATAQRQVREELVERVSVDRHPLTAEVQAQVRADAIRDPLAGAPLYLTGASRGLEGDAKGAEQLVRLSIERNPRLMAARYWMIRHLGEQRRAAEAADATLRVLALDPESYATMVPILVELTKYRESWPRIRAALPTAGTWREIYFNLLVQQKFDPSIVFSAIDVAKSGGSARPSVREQTGLLSSMIARGDYDRAYTAWLGWLSPAELVKVAYLYDGGFTGAPGAPPFNWTLSSGGIGTAEIEASRGLRFDFTPSDPLQLASQTIVLPAGAYRLRVAAMLDRAMGEGGDGLEVPLQWQVTCLTDRRVIAEVRLPDATELKTVAVRFEVPANCPAQQVQLTGSSMEFPVRMGGFVRSVAIDQQR